MLSVVKSLLFRLKKSKLFWILLGVCVLLPVLSALLNTVILEIAEQIAGMPLGGGLEMLTYMSISELANISSDVNLMVLLCVSIFLCKEFVDGTIRNTLLSNKSRSAVYGAYGIVSLIIGGAYLMANFASSLLVLGIPFGFGDVTAAQAITSCACSLVLGVCSLLFVVSCVLMFMFATGKQAPSIVLPLLIALLLPSFISVAVEIAAYIISLMQANSDGAVSFTTDFYTWIPFYNALLFDATKVEGHLVAKIAGYYTVFSGLFVLVGIRAANRRDLK